MCCKNFKATIALRSVFAFSKRRVKWIKHMALNWFFYILFTLLLTLILALISCFQLIIIHLLNYFIVCLNCRDLLDYFDVFLNLHDFIVFFHNPQNIAFFPLNVNRYIAIFIFSAIPFHLIFIIWEILFGCILKKILIKYFYY